MKTQRIAVLASLVLASSGVPFARATVTPLSSSIDLHAEANAGLGLIQDDKTVSQTTFLNPLSASVFAQAINGSLKDSAASTATASWSSASQGQFTLYDNFTSDNLPYQSARVATGGLAWIYSFSSDVAATLSLNFQITHSGSFPYGNHMAFGQLIDHGSFQTIQGPGFNAPTNGVLDFPLNAGQTYTFTLYDGANLNQNLPAFTSEMNGAFSFLITPVPEPGSLALFCGSTAILFRRSLRRKGGRVSDLRRERC